MYVTLYFNNYNQSLNSANQVNDRESKQPIRIWGQCSLSVLSAGKCIRQFFNFSWLWLVGSCHTCLPSFWLEHHFHKLIISLKYFRHSLKKLWFSEEFFFIASDSINAFICVSCRQTDKNQHRLAYPYVKRPRNSRTGIKLSGTWRSFICLPVPVTTAK